MPLEIERKFLVFGDAWKEQSEDAVYLRQGYLNIEKQCSVRVRTDGHSGWLNIKGVTIGAQRREFEYEIPVKEAEELLQYFSTGPLIEKRRYFVRSGRHIWEIDVFEGENKGLVVAEIELEDPDEDFERPNWLGAEVTHDARYYNTHLARKPYLSWDLSPE